MRDHRARFLAARRAADRANVSRRLAARGGLARRRLRGPNANGALFVARPFDPARGSRSAAAETRNLFYPVVSIADGCALDWSHSYTTFLFNAQRATRDGEEQCERILFGPPSARPLAQLRRQHAERRRYVHFIYR